MKKVLLSGMLLLGGLSANAQLADGSVAPDFTLTDINGNSHHLYAYLDQGYTVFIDVSATWCGPCWNYHNTHALDDLWTAHGPTGGNGVAGNTTDDVVVFFIEGDGSTNSADLNGTGSSTQGDWVTGVDHPIIDPATTEANAFNNDYAIGYFPTIYKICPNRIITEVGQQTAANLYASVADCPPPASDPADVSALSYSGGTVVCGGSSITPVITIQNTGTNALTSATITITSGGNTVSTGSYSGSLSTYGTANVTCSAITGYTGGTLTITVTTSGDANAANGTLSQVISSATQATGIQAQVIIVTDAYGSETTWTLKNSGGTTVSSGGPYNDLSAAGTTTQPTVNVTLSADECYTFTIDDAYGDGIDAGYGAGSYTVKDGTGATLVTGGQFTDTETKAFRSGTSGGGLIEFELAGFNVYPNPASGVVNVSFNAENTDYTVAVTDVAGRVLTSANYSNLAGMQNIEVSLAGITAGNYILTVSSENGQANKKIMVK